MASSREELKPTPAMMQEHLRILCDAEMREKQELEELESREKQLEKEARDAEKMLKKRRAGALQVEELLHKDQCKVEQLAADIDDELKQQEKIQNEVDQLNAQLKELSDSDNQKLVEYEESARILADKSRKASVYYKDSNMKRHCARLQKTLAVNIERSKRLENTIREEEKVFHQRQREEGEDLLEWDFATQVAKEQVVLAMKTMEVAKKSLESLKERKKTLKAALSDDDADSLNPAA